VKLMFLLVDVSLCRRMVVMSTLERVKKLCDNHGITVPMLEERLGIPNNTIYQWKEGSKRKPSLERLEMIADYFNVSLDYLRGRTTETKVETIAAHYEGDEWTDEELEEIKQFKEFVRMKRKQ